MAIHENNFFFKVQGSCIVMQIKFNSLLLDFTDTWNVTNTFNFYMINTNWSSLYT